MRPLLPEVSSSVSLFTVLGFVLQTQSIRSTHDRICRDGAAAARACEALCRASFGPPLVGDSRQADRDPPTSPLVSEVGPDSKDQEVLHLVLLGPDGSTSRRRSPLGRRAGKSNCDVRGSCWEGSDAIGLRKRYFMIGELVISPRWVLGALMQVRGPDARLTSRACGYVRAGLRISACG